MGIGFQERDCVFCMSVIAEISEGKENPSCLADMRFFPIVLCSMLHCKKFVKALFLLGGKPLISRSYALVSSFLLYGIPQSGGLYRLSCFL